MGQKNTERWTTRQRGGERGRKGGMEGVLEKIRSVKTHYCDDWKRRCRGNQSVS